MEISKADFIDWLKSDVTKFVFKELNRQEPDYIKLVRSAVREGNITKASYYEGVLAGFDKLRLIDYDDVEYEESNDES